MTRRALLSLISIALPASILAGLSVFIFSMTTFSSPSLVANTDILIPETVYISPRHYVYHPTGLRLYDGRNIAAPPTNLLSAPLTIMKYQVSTNDYALCIAEGACGPVDKRADTSPNRPVTGVSFLDATAYAKWLSAKTGQVWRLPTDQEWVVAAAERYVGVETIDDNPDNPAERWLADYRDVKERSADIDPAPRPLGSFGENTHGIADMAGNVWEWTDTCYERLWVDAQGNVQNRLENCGVHVVAGRHTAYISAFIKDARSGGCSVGVPPANLGFRLVRAPTDGGPLTRLTQWLQGQRS